MEALNRQFSPTCLRGGNSTRRIAFEWIIDCTKPVATHLTRQLPLRQCTHTDQPGLQLCLSRHFYITLLISSLVLSTGQASACCEENPPRAGVANNSIESEAKLELSVIALATEEAAPAAQHDIRSDAAARLASEAESNYLKISASGDHLDENATTWECVEDKSSKLTWEVKKNDGGVRDRDYSYTWFNKNGGIRNGGRCEGNIDCDTYSYTQAMNASKLCGFSDWRLPTRTELETLIEYNNNPEHATINKTYFPEAVASWYWTASEHPLINSYAWYVLFQNGRALNDLKERPKHIRLVRGNAVK